MAKFYDIPQYEPEWYALRLGIPTASEFERIITAGGAFSDQTKGFANEKIAEMMSGVGESRPVTRDMANGTIEEIAARDYYCFINELEINQDVTRGGFWTTDAGDAGASPDFCIGKDGLGEIKTLKAKNHVEALLGENDEVIAKPYRPQTQGQLWVAEREWADLVLYHGTMKKRIIRVHRDEKYIALLKDGLFRFRDLMGQKILQLKAMDRWTDPPVLTGLGGQPYQPPGDQKITDAG